MNLKRTYNKIAEDWNKDHENDTWWIAGTAKFSEYFKPGEKILDVGCAGGLKSEFLVRKGLNVTGIDLSEEMISIAKHRVPQGKFFVKDINQALNLDKEFDGIFAQAVLLHIPKNNIKAVLQNLLSVLKPNGFIYIAVKETKQGEREERDIIENDYGYEYERFFSFFTFDELKSCFAELNLKLVFSDITAIGETNWIQLIAQNG